MVPSPEPAVLLMKAVGSSPLQMVVSLPITPAPGTLCTVTVMALAALDSQVNEFSVESVILRYWVVKVRPAGTS